MDQTLAGIIAAVAAIITPTVVFVMQRATAKKLDAFDQKRDAARVEREAEERRNAEWQQAMTGGMRSMLRSELLHEYNKWTDKGFCPMESKEYVERTYLSYHALGGNGIGTSMYDEVMALPMGHED
jgi:hypothetical protein